MVATSSRLQQWRQNELKEWTTKLVLLSELVVHEPWFTYKCRQAFVILIFDVL